MSRSTPMVLNHIYRTRWYGFSGNQSSVNSVCLVVTAITLPAPLQGETIDSLDGVIGPLFINLMSTQSEHVGADIQDVTGAPPFLLPAATVVGAGAGAVAGGQLPGQVCGVISLLTDTSGRQFRGRMYVPFPAQADCTAVNPTTPIAGYVTRLTLLSAAFVGQETLAGIAGGSVTFSWAIKHGLPKVGPVPLPSPITNARSNKLWGTQRRRGNYGRPNSVPIP